MAVRLRLDVLQNRFRQGSVAAPNSPIVNVSFSPSVPDRRMHFPHEEEMLGNHVPERRRKRRERLIVLCEADAAARVVCPNVGWNITMSWMLDKRREEILDLPDARGIDRPISR